MTFEVGSDVSDDEVLVQLWTKDIDDQEFFIGLIYLFC
jgi:hypothetical protein